MTVADKATLARAALDAECRGRHRLLAAVKSEWVKLRSLRSTWWAVASIAAVLVGYAALIGHSYSARWTSLSPLDRASFDPTHTVLQGFLVVQIVLGALGVLVVGNEYGTGSIRTSLLAVPRRGVFLAGKLTPFLVLCALVTAVASAAAFGVGQLTIHGGPSHASWTQPGVARAVAGCAVYLTLIGLMGAALAAIVRSTAIAIATLFMALLVVPIVVNGIPASLKQQIEPYLPLQAGERVTSVRPLAHSFGPGTSIALLCGYCALLVVVAYWCLRRRDA